MNKRESLFGSVFKNKVQPPRDMRFSTFGYDTPSDQPQRYSSNPRDCSGSPSTGPNTIEMQDFGHMTDIPTPPLPPSMNKQFAVPRKERKMEESRVMLEIRNSAPDVIIMTSH